jgi:hypothetical protein
MIPAGLQYYTVAKKEFPTAQVPLLTANHYLLTVTS